MTLAFVAALGTVLFDLVQRSGRHDLEFNVLIVIACVPLFLTALFCGLTLMPRVGDTDAVPYAINRLFYASIARNFEGDRVRYTSVLSTLTSNPEELVMDLAHQIHANARIATVKNARAKHAIVWAFVSGGLVGSVALIVGVNGTR